MNPVIRRKLEQNTAELQSKLARHGTRDVINSFAKQILEQINDDDAPATLASVARRCAFAISLLAASPEPETPVRFDEAAWHDCASLLDQIFGAYVDMYWATDPSKHPPSARMDSPIPMLAFLHYFHAGINASTDQVAERIRTYLVPFDDQLQQLVGLSASVAIDICDAIMKRTESQLKSLMAMGAEEKRLRLALIDRWENENWDPSRVREEARAIGYGEHFDEMTSLMDRLYRIDLTDLRQQFGASGEVFWSQFSIGRGEGPRVEYLTERLSYDSTPLIRFDPGHAAFITPHHIYTAVLKKFEETIIGSSGREAYFSFRDRAVEEETASALKRLFPNATIHRGLFETETTQFEHDIVLINGDTCIIAEVKASPPVEPFRDPAKAFERIIRAFRSDRGMQKAYDQAHRVRHRWARGETVSLFDRKGNKRLQIDPATIGRCFIMCITRDDYGPLATDLSSLLKKSLESPYPWATNILTLSHLIDGWLSLGFGEQEFLAFIDARTKLHGRVFGTDELEFAGYYLRHGSMSRLLSKTSEHVLLNPSYSDVFDDVYLSTRGGPPVELRQTEPVEFDMREALLGASAPGPAEAYAAIRRARKRQRPNDPCACASGRKYKKCCGVL